LSAKLRAASKAHGPGMITGQIGSGRTARGRTFGGASREFGRAGRDDVADGRPRQAGDSGERRELGAKGPSHGSGSRVRAGGARGSVHRSYTDSSGPFTAAGTGGQARLARRPGRDGSTIFRRHPVKTEITRADAPATLAVVPDTVSLPAPLTDSHDRSQI
jgi:hypothetical protein